MFHRAKKCLALYLLVSLVTYTGLVSAKNGIVQKDFGSRLGDRLLILCAVKFLALTHDLDSYYIPSQFLDEFGLSQTETKYDDSIKTHYKKLVTFSESSCKQTQGSTLFLAPWSAIDHMCQYFGKRHLHRTHFNQLQTMVTPLHSLPKLDIPPDTISVAVHIRKGDGHDNPLKSAQIYKNVDQIFWGDNPHAPEKGAPADNTWPYKFPPEQYYIDQIRALEELLPDKKINFYIFSDSFNPQALTERIATYCAKENAAFINASSSKTDSPITDMYKMSSCECLIRPESSYSIIAQIMGNHKIVFSPQSCDWRNNILYVTHVKLTLFDSVKNNAMEYTLEQCDKNILKQWVTELFS